MPFTKKDLNDFEFMDSIALSVGTVKASFQGNITHNNGGVNYTYIYPKYFAHLRHNRINFLEIGIFKGQSVRLWEQYFPNAELHFIDIEERKHVIEYFSARSQYHFIDNKDSERLRKFALAFGPFDFIVDDADHSMLGQITSFEVLFPFVKPGGIYIIEDLFTSYSRIYNYELTRIEKDYHGLPAGPGTTIQYLKNLVDDIYYVSKRNGLANFGNVSGIFPEMYSNMSYYAKHIEAIHFYDSICFVLKRS